MINVVIDQMMTFVVRKLERVDVGNTGAKLIRWLPTGALILASRSSIVCNHLVEAALIANVSSRMSSALQ